MEYKGDWKKISSGRLRIFDWFDLSVDAEKSVVRAVHRSEDLIKFKKKSIRVVEEI